jgi:hypothetical protein
MKARRTIKVSSSVMKSTRMTDSESHQRAEHVSSDSPHGSATPNPGPHVCPSAGLRHLKAYAAKANTQWNGDYRIRGHKQKGKDNHLKEENGQVQRIQ